MNDIKLSSIVAMAENNVIGKDNDLLWHIPEDFKHFKRTTMGCPMIMGRKTYDSLPGALKGRTHIIVSRSVPENPPEKDPDGPDLLYATSLEDAIQTAKEIAANDDAKQAFIIGGGQIYEQTLPMIDRLYLTVVHEEFEGDTSFPALNWDEWDITGEERHSAGDKTPAFTIFTLDRK